MGEVIKSRVLALQEEIFELKDEIQSLRNRISENIKKMDRKDNKIIKLKDDLNYSERERISIHKRYLSLDSKVSELTKENISLTEKNTILKENNRKLSEENQRLKKWLEDPESPDRIKNPRSAGRKQHNSLWKNTYELYKHCFEEKLTLSECEAYINKMIRISNVYSLYDPKNPDIPKIIRRYSIDKFSKSTYYRFKKYYEQENK